MGILLDRCFLVSEPRGSIEAWCFIQNPNRLLFFLVVYWTLYSGMRTMTVNQDSKASQLNIELKLNLWTALNKVSVMAQHNETFLRENSILPQTRQLYVSLILCNYGTWPHSDCALSSLCAQMWDSINYRSNTCFVPSAQLIVWHLTALQHLPKHKHAPSCQRWISMCWGRLLDCHVQDEPGFMLRVGAAVPHSGAHLIVSQQHKSQR